MLPATKLSLPARCFIAKAKQSDQAAGRASRKHGEAGRKQWWQGGPRRCGQAAPFLGGAAGRRVLTCDGGRAAARGHHAEVVAVDKPRYHEEDPAGRLRRRGDRDRRCHRAHRRRRLGLLAERDADVLVLRRYATNNI